MSTNNHLVEPEPTGDDTYDEPLLEWIGEKVVAEWAGRKIEGVVVDVELEHDGHRFGEHLTVSTDVDATISVEPDEVLASTRDL